jgi:iron complex outermembrane receptor protein
MKYMTFTGTADNSSGRRGRLLPSALMLGGLAGLAGVATPALAAAQPDDTPATLDQVTINGSPTPAYQARTASMGPLGQQSVLDAPYTIDVLPSELLQNQQLKSVAEAFRYLPGVQGDNIRPQTRGLQAGVVQNTRIDGMNIASTTDYPIEQFDRIEVLEGLAGALYGPANPAGTFNYVLKRPTATPLRHVSVEYATQGGKMASADLGDSFGDSVGDGKRFGYRVNLLDDNGESFVEGSNLKRKLASLAFDIRITDNTRLETNASRYHYTTLGLPGTFALANNVRFPSAPDPTTFGYGQPFAGDDNVTTTDSARLIHQFNRDWQLSAGVLRQESDRASTVPTNTLTNTAGAYKTTVATTTFSLDTILSNTVALNGHVDAAGLRHDLVLSNTGFDWKRYTPFQTGAITLGTASLADPLIFAEPVFPDFKSRYKALTTRQQSITAGDTVGFGDKWSAGLFLSQSEIDVSNFSKTGATTSSYHADGLSTNATVSYKPQSNANVYVSYADNLQQGDMAPAGSANIGTSLDAYRSKQWELGYKMALGKLQTGVALFRIERPFAFVDTDNVFKEVGNQVNKGVELTASGDITSRLAVYGGLSWLDPRVFDTGSAATDGKQVLGLSRLVGSLLFDYSVPQIRGLSLNLFLNHTSSMPGDNANTYQVDGHNIADIGARYARKILGRNATWMLAVKNVTNQTYWANITPSGQNGYTGAGNGTGTIGAPRTVRLSLQLDL